jgi:hypothetical protein
MELFLHIPSWCAQGQIICEQTEEFFHAKHVIHTVTTELLTVKKALLSVEAFAVDRI